MSAPRPVVDQQARAALDRLDHALSIASSLRDPDGTIRDFRLVFVNAAAARWAGVPAGSQEGRLVTEFVPALRTTGLFETLVRVVDTGEPFYVAAGAYSGEIAGDRAVDGIYDLGAVRHGDGYLSIWRRLPDDAPPEAGSTRDLRDSLEVARDVVRLVRLE